MDACYKRGMDNLLTIRLWAAAAWADDVLHESEAAALRRLIEATELNKIEEAEAAAFFDAPPELDINDSSLLSPEAREGVYRAALGIVMLDRELAEGEKEFLERLAKALALPDEIIERLGQE